MKRTILAVGLCLALLFSVTASHVTGTAQAASQSATHSQSHPAFFDKSRFAIHLGLAYFAFHHFVYNPYKAGSFKAGANHGTVNIVKAGAALLITYHELKLAYNIAKGSNSGLLHALIKPMTGLINQAGKVANKLRGGQYNDAEVKGVVNSANAFSQTATHNGFSIKDIKVPGL